MRRCWTRRESAAPARLRWMGPLADVRFFVVMSRGRKIEPGQYRLRFTAWAADVTTLVTRYDVSDDGLPAQIIADGTPLLRGPVMLLEDGRPLRGTMTKRPESADVVPPWESQFDGESCSVRLSARCEYDG